MYFVARISRVIKGKMNINGLPPYVTLQKKVSRILCRLPVCHLCCRPTLPTTPHIISHFSLNIFPFFVDVVVAAVARLFLLLFVTFSRFFRSLASELTKDLVTLNVLARDLAPVYFLNSLNYASHKESHNASER